MPAVRSSGSSREQTGSPGPADSRGHSGSRTARMLGSSWFVVPEQAFVVAPQLGEAVVGNELQTVGEALFEGELESL